MNRERGNGVQLDTFRHRLPDVRTQCHHHTDVFYLPCRRLHRQITLRERVNRPDDANRHGQQHVCMGGEENTAAHLQTIC